MLIEIPEKREAALKIQAHAHGISPAGYVCEVLEAFRPHSRTILGRAVQDGPGHD